MASDVYSLGVPLYETEALIIERVGEPHPLVDRVRALRARARSG